MSSLIEGWLQELQNNGSSHDDSKYWATRPKSLIASSQPASFSLGSGHQLFTSMLSRCEATQQELIIVTCFWAKSPTQESLASLLRKLSANAESRGQKVRVRICFSSLSLVQKLFHTSSSEGRTYPPLLWVSLGLPAPEDLTGLDLVVKSLFIRPFSVMHPKFILVDRKLAFMPSCNVSWEEWFEGCIELNGLITEQLFDFWKAVWSTGGAVLPPSLGTKPVDNPDSAELPPTSTIRRIDFPASTTSTTTILLPSQYHSNPRIQFFSFNPQPPPTPLNTFLLHVISHAKSDIYMQTPNLTCYAVISALVAALRRGIHVHIVTSARLMILEQLVTAGTITEYEVWKLRRRHQSMLSHHQRTLERGDLESLIGKIGEMKIGYYHARESRANEPVKSHLKCTIVDQEVVVLGSGNMDRASWYTSQELGVAFLSTNMARGVRNTISEGLEGRVRYVC